ncbi:MAG: TonB-dependent receptor plug domain-containing protein, partial [Opitutaceae bacterium]
MALTTFVGRCVSEVGKLLRMSQHFAASPHVVATALCCALSVTAVTAATDQRRSYNIPKGDAAATLNQFAAASGQHIVFMMDKVKGEKTSAIAGEYSAREALDRMLAGTRLSAAQDPASGAFVVSRKASTTSNGSANAHFPTKASVEGSPKIMNRKNPLALIGAWLAVVLAPSQAAESGGTDTPKPDEVVVLSPFVVNTEKDTGYAATNTLAGTRLNTSLKDIGSSISIYTKNFLTDLGATNANELLIYATGMEAAGAQGNFSGLASNINTPTVVGDSVRTFPQGATRTRGLSSPNFTRGLFNTSIPIDSFNTETVTVNRGPNAILFGVGSPAGVVDTTLLSANLRRNLNTVEFRYGNNDSFRSSLDLNRVLIPNKLALRLAAVDDNEKFNQRPTFEDKRRIFGTVTAKPFASTTLRANLEAGRTRANRPLNVLPFKSIAPQWYEAGQPTIDWTFYDDPTRNPNAASQAAGLPFWGAGLWFAEFYDQISIVYSRANATTHDASFRGTIPHTSGTVANAVRTSLFHPLANRDLRDDTTFSPGTANVAEIQGFRWPGGSVPAGIKYQGFTDFSAFDFKNRMLDETGRQQDSLRVFNVAIEQLAWKDRLGVELAYNSERYDRRSRNPLMQFSGGNHVRVDVNVTLPTGQPNPNLGRPYL